MICSLLNARVSAFVKTLIYAQSDFMLMGFFWGGVFFAGDPWYINNRCRVREIKMQEKSNAIE